MVSLPNFIQKMMIHHWILANLQWFLSLSDIPTLRRCFCWWSATWMQCRRLSDRPQSLDKLARLERNGRVSLVSHRKTAEFLGSAGAPMEMMSHISQMMFQNRQPRLADVSSLATSTPTTWTNYWSCCQMLCFHLAAVKCRKSLLIARS